MKKSHKYKSITNFRSDVKRIQDLIGGIITAIKVFEKLPEMPILSNKANEFKKLIIDYPYLEFRQENIDNIFELGFIRVYAGFEAFMYEFLKELYKKYPKSIPLDKKIQISDILDWKTKKSVNDFIIDHVAIENSYDYSTWEKTLKNSFGIEIFEDENIKESFITLNLCRNMLVHSGGKTNSKVLNDFNRIFNKSRNSNQTFKIEKVSVDERLFSVLVNVTLKIVSYIDKATAQKTLQNK